MSPPAPQLRVIPGGSSGEPTESELGQVDANVQKVLDGRAQMAAMDEELFSSLSQGYPPQKRAKLALVLARLNHEMKGFKKGRHGGR